MEKSTKIVIGIGLSAVLIATTFIFRNQIKASIKKIFGGYKWFDESLNWYRSLSTKEGVEDLHPDFRDDVKEFFSWIEKNTDWDVIWSSGRRTFEHQAELHEEDERNAEAGKSDHNYGFAFDINLINRRTGVQLKKASSKSEWMSTGS